MVYDKRWHALKAIADWKDAAREIIEAVNSRQRPDLPNGFFTTTATITAYIAALQPPLQYQHIQQFYALAVKLSEGKASERDSANTAGFADLAVMELNVAENAASDSARPNDLRSAYDYRVVRRINTGTLNKARESKRINGHKIGGRWFYSEAEVRVIYPEKFEG